MSKDPVCGMEVNQNTATAKTNYQGREYLFCSQDCKRQFDQDPERYGQQQTRGAAPRRSEGGEA